MKGPSLSGSSLPPVVGELWCSGSPVCVFGVSRSPGGSVPLLVRGHAMGAGGFGRVLRDWWPRWTGPPGPLGWMERCVTQLVPVCGSALHLWIPGQAGWVLLCCGVVALLLTGGGRLVLWPGTSGSPLLWSWRPVPLASEAVNSVGSCSPVCVVSDRCLPVCSGANPSFRWLC